MAWSFSTLFGLTFLAYVFDYFSVGASFLILGIPKCLIGTKLLGILVIPLCIAGYYIYPPDITQSHENQTPKEILRSMWRLTKLVLFPSTEPVYDKLEDGIICAMLPHIQGTPAEAIQHQNEGGVVAVSLIGLGLLMTMANVFIFTSLCRV